MTNIRPALDKAFFRRRTVLLERLKDGVIIPAELIELNRTNDLLNEYIYEMKVNRRRSKNGRLTTC